MDKYVSKASAPLVGTTHVPGDKSISHRAVMLAALARGRSVVRGANLGADVGATCAAVRSLGVAVEVDAGSHTVEVESSGWAGLSEPEDVVDARNSGTTARTVLAVCAAAPGGAVVSGDATLRRRPMLRVVAPLRAMGATIDGRRGGDRLPLWVRGGPLRAIRWRSEVASAQVKTAVLLAASRAAGTTELEEPRLSRDHTERMLAGSGVILRRDGLRVAVDGPQEIRPTDRAVPGDVSSALFLVVAALVVPGSDLTIVDVGLNPTRAGALEVLRRMGADVSITARGESGGEPFGDLRARSSELRATDIVPEEVPALIDELPALAVAASRAVGTTTVAGAAELRVKESDRIEAIVGGLRALGVHATPRPDGFTITGPAEIDVGAIDARGDHRIALAFAVAGMCSSGGVTLEGWSATETSFPGWDRTVASVAGAPAGDERSR